MLSQWHALVEDKKPAVAVELERHLLEFLFSSAAGNLDSKEFDSKLATILNGATNGSDAAIGEKIMELTKKYALSSLSKL